MKKFLPLIAFLSMSLLSFGNNKYLPFQNFSNYNQPLTTTAQQLRLNLYGYEADGHPFIVDGTFTEYGPSYSDNVDGMDARKLFNGAENISLRRGNYDLIIERRKTFVHTDTIFFRMWGMKKKMYKMEFVGKNFIQEGWSATLQDSYSKKSTDINLNDTTKVNILINNDPASYDQNRFKILLKNTFEQIPLCYTLVNSAPQNNQVNIKWQTKNPDGLKQYVVERSMDNKTFYNLFSMTIHNFSVDGYNWTDNNPLTGNNYYRIRIISNDGNITYSNVSISTVIKDAPDITLFPNPASYNNINLKLVNQPTGIYSIKLISQSGQMVTSKAFAVSVGNSTLHLNNREMLPHGIYQLLIANPSGIVYNFHLVVQ